MARADPAEIAGSDRQAARERGFRLLAATVTALFAAFLCLGLVLLWYDNAAKWVGHTHQVRSGIADVVQALTKAEAAQRGFLLTGEPLFLEQLEDAREEADATITAVDLMTLDNPAQQRRVEILRTRMGQRMAVIDETVKLGRKGRVAEAAEIIRRGEGLAAMAAVRSLITDLDRAEARLEARRAAHASMIRAGVVLALVVFALLLGALFIKAVRDISLDREAETETAERLRDLLRQRTLLLDEVNHRVKNSLQQIASVVRLQARAARATETKDALEKTLTRIMAVGRVHELTYKSGEGAGMFDAGLYAQTLAADLVGSLGRDEIALETEVDFIQLEMRQASPIALILNELITNALKYGCPPNRPGCIVVRFKAEAGQYKLTVADQGDGLSEEFSVEEKKSLGMRVIQALARQLGGELVVDQPTVGAEFSVVFPRDRS